MARSHSPTFTKGSLLDAPGPDPSLKTALLSLIIRTVQFFDLDNPNFDIFAKISALDRGRSNFQVNLHNRGYMVIIGADELFKGH